MDEEWTEEELLVYVDYGKYLPASEISDPDMQFKIIGLNDGEKSIYSEINGKLFSGSYADAVGTNLFFVEDPVPSKSDNIFEKTSEKTFSLQAKSSKLIQMKRIFVEPKETNDPEEVIEPNRNPNSLRKYTVDQTYQEALDKLLKAGQLPPRTVTDALDNKIMLSRELEMECSEAE